MPQDIDRSNYKYGGWIVFISIAIVEIVLLFKFIHIPCNSTTILPAIVIIAGLLMLSPRIFEIVTFNLAKDKFSVELNRMQKKVEKAEENINDISEKVNTLFLMTMSPAMYDNLRKIVTEKFGPYDMTDILRRELYHLRSIGYIDVLSISKIPPHGHDLSVYIKATQAGKQFTELREKLSVK